MAMPANVTTVVVAGTFVTPEGTPSTGTVTFTPSRWLNNPGADVAIPNSSVTKTLGTAGNFTVTLPVTDDADLEPGNWFYVVSENVDGVTQSYDILLAGSAATNGTVFLADIAPAAELGPEYASLQGPAGAAATLTIGTTTSVNNAGTAEVTNSGTSSAAILDFVLRDGPTGPQGSQGVQGDAATVNVGTVGSVAFGGTATVTNSGTTGAAVLDFVVVTGPQGIQGDQGIQGIQGDQGIQGIQGIQGDQGIQGATGTAAVVTVGTVSTVAFGGTPAVTNSGTSGSAVLDFVLVTGPQGDLAGLSANAPIAYAANTFSLNIGSGLETVGTTLAANFADASAQNLGAAAAGTSVELSRGDHVHAMPGAADVGAIGTASLSSSSALALGTAAAGTATTVARDDHVHPTDGVVLNSLVTAKGDLVAASASGTPDNLAVGTNEHRLVADSAETTGLKYVADTTNYVVAAKGDLLVGTAADTVAAVTVGTNGHRLVADSGETAGVKWAADPVTIGVACSDETTDLATGTGVVTFRMPHAMTLTGVRAGVTTAPTGADLEIDINEAGSTILSTILSIDDGEKTSTTAATAAVISDSALADDAEITIDIDQVGSTVAGAGLKVWLIGARA